MRHFLLVFLFACAFSTMQAQRPHFFVEAGLGISNQLMASQQQGYKIKAKGMEIYKPTYGIGMEWAFDRKHSFEVAVFHYVTGSITDYRTTTKEYFQFKYIKVPLQYRHNINFGKEREHMFVTVGPYVSFMYQGWMTFNGLPYRVDREPRDLFKGTDFGLGVGIGYQTPIGLYFRGSFSRGFKDLVKPASTAPGVNSLSLYNVAAFAFTTGFNI